MKFYYFFDVLIIIVIFFYGNVIFFGFYENVNQEVICNLKGIVGQSLMIDM